MKKNEAETRGRPRDAVYEAIAEDVEAHVRRYPDQTAREWAYDISTGARGSLRSRYLGFRQSTTFKEMKARLLAKGFATSLFFDGEDVTLRVVKNG